MKTYFLLSPICGLLLAGSPFAFVTNAFAQNDSPNFWKDIPKGPQVHGYFVGRSPCQDIARMLNVSGRESCIKIKWQLLLYQDAATGAPTTYALGGFAWRNPPKTGKWAIVKGTKEDPNAVVYQLDPESPQASFSFLKMDENILFFLDQDRNLLVGNSRFSYTLNRVTKP
jgi:hypothetical protein